MPACTGSPRQPSVFWKKPLKPASMAIFYAVQHGQYGLLSTDEFADFCRPYDLQVLEAARGLWLNLLHLHGEAVMFDQVLDYPVQIINWHDRQTPPTLAEAQARFHGVVCGGLRQWETMVLGQPEQVRAEAQDAIQQTQREALYSGHRLRAANHCPATAISWRPPHRRNQERPVTTPTHYRRHSPRHPSADGPG